MTEKDIIRFIDEGANFYVSLFGCAEHMQIVECGHYRCVKPRTDVHGISFVYDIQLNGLPAKVQEQVVQEIKELGMPFWLDLSSDDDLFALFFQKEKVHGQTVFDEDDEIYLALLPEEQENVPARHGTVRKVQTPEDFVTWANISNRVLAGGLPDMHPVFHYPLCSKGLMNCYIAYSGETPAAVCATMNHNGIVSLEFVATLPEHRRKGLAAAACAMAVHDAFDAGARIITVRAMNLAAGKLYQSIGFQEYNHAI